MDYEGEGFLLVYSVTSRSSFTHIQRYHNRVRKFEEISSTSVRPVMLVGNNGDQIAEREVSTQEGLF